VAKSVDPLAALAKQLGGSKRNALLKWCQNRTATYTVCAALFVTMTTVHLLISCTLYSIHNSAI